MSNVIHSFGRGFIRWLAVLGFLIAAAPALAEDSRPTEIAYVTPGPVPLLTIDHGRNVGEQVRIADNALHPRLVELQAGETMSWTSYSSAPSRIVFEREVAASMVCHGLVNFRLEDDELRSADLNQGEVASFCELPPGRYRYRVIRPHHKSGGAGGAARRLEGEILVSEPG